MEPTAGEPQLTADHSTGAATRAGVAGEAGFWVTVREALHGSRRDYTEGSVGRAILLLAIPMVLEVVLESVFAVADIFWVAHLGEDAIATVGLTESIMSIVYTLAIGLTIGATATVARRIGEKNPDGAARAAVQALALGLIIAATLAGFGGSFSSRVLRALGASPDVVMTGVNFTRVMLGGDGKVGMLFLVK